MKFNLYYCYDAYCGWCYGFSSVMQQIAQQYNASANIEVLSGGMIIGSQPKHIGTIAAFIKEHYPTVEATTGVKFGADFLWHINNPDLSDWFPYSEKPAIALSIFKSMLPNQQLAFATDLQYALNFEGRDLCDDEAYRHLLEKYKIGADLFYKLLHEDIWKKAAYEEFDLCKQLQVKGFPAVFIQPADNKFYMVANGYTPFETVKDRIETILTSNATEN